MQVLQGQGLHPAEGLLTALTANSRTVLGLHQQGQQWAWSRGNFINVSVGRRARAEMAPAAAGRAVPGFHKPLQISRKVIPLIMGTTAQTFPLGAAEREAHVPSGQSLAPPGQLSAWLWSCMPRRRLLHQRLTAFPTAGTALGFAQAGRAARREGGAGLAPLTLPPASVTPKHFVAKGEQSLTP